MLRLVIGVALVGGCSSPPPASRETSPLAPAAVQPSEGEREPSAVTPTAAVTLPGWLRDRLPVAAVSLIGGDDEFVDVLFGQFEHPQEAIVRFSRDSGCAAAVIGPWPTLSTVVLGRAGFDGPGLSAAELVTTASSGELRAELATIIPIYARHQKQGEDKLQFGLDGQSVIMEATDERMIASSDGGRQWQHVAGNDIDAAVVSPGGDVAVVRFCDRGRCGGPPRAARYRPGLVSFARLPDVSKFGGPTVHDVVFDRSGKSLVVARSDVYGRAAPTRLCLERWTLPGPRGPKRLGCVPTAYVGYSHALSVSPDRQTAAIAAIDRQGGVRLTVRSLIDGSEKASFDVPGVWENYQWVWVLVSNEGRIAHYAEFDANPYVEHRAGSIKLYARGEPPREIANARPLGWLPGGALVYLNLGAPLDPRGCGLIKTDN